MKLKKGDKIQIITGKDRVKKTKKGDKTNKGNQGKVLSVLDTKEKVVVEGLNLRFKHVRPKKEGEKGQVVEKPGFLSIGKVKMLCPKCNKASRVGYKLTEKGKQRICKKCSAAI